MEHWVLDDLGIKTDDLTNREKENFWTISQGKTKQKEIKDIIKKSGAEPKFSPLTKMNSRYVNGKKMLINEKIEKYTWLEPSVGEGCFYDLLPANKKIGIDIEPKRKDVIKSDYLKYKLPKKSK